MPDNQTVQVLGLQETIRTLQKMGAKVQDMKDAFHRIGTIVSDEIKTLAPVRTGKLASTVKASNTKNKSIVRAGTGIKYAGVQNYGWAHHNITGQYFMERGLRAKHDQVVQEFEIEMHGLIRGLGLDQTL